MSTESFLDKILGDLTGQLCVVTIHNGTKTEYRFAYPDDLYLLDKRIAEWNNAQGTNVYFYPTLDDDTPPKVVSADLNMVNPALVVPRPDIIVESSSGRYQAYWYNSLDLTPLSINGPVVLDNKLRRLPGTHNWKYNGSLWKVRETNPASLDTFERVKKNRGLSSNSFDSLFKTCDRMSLARLCARLGCSTVETYLVLEAAQRALMDKPGDDGYVPISVLYQDALAAVKAVGIPSLLADDEIRQLADSDSVGSAFVDRYVGWATKCTDSPRQYHVAGALTILSIILSPHVQLPTSFDDFRCNLWFMILADTTSTRKTTAMQMAIKLARSVDPECLLTNSGSGEGIISALAGRGGKSSIFFRDEISGFLEETTQKRYMSGILESLTGLYDGMSEKRTLRGSVIEVEDPYLQIMCGGIRTRTIELLDTQHISSGFLPRFMFVFGETKPEDIKPIGPPKKSNSDLRNSMIEYLDGMNRYYSAQTDGGKLNPRNPLKICASEAAWQRMEQLEEDARNLGLASDNPNIFSPMYDRLKNSIIKVSVLIAAERSYRDKSELVLELEDLIIAISYSQTWIESMHEVARGIEDKPTKDEMRRTRIERFIRASEQGVFRGDIMRRYHLNAKEMDEIESTLIQRGEIVAATTGRKSTIYRAAIEE